MRRFSSLQNWHQLIQQVSGILYILHPCLNYVLSTCFSNLWLFRSIGIRQSIGEDKLSIYFHSFPVGHLSENHCMNCFIIQNTAYPTPKPKGNMIHGRHNVVSLNFQAKIPTAKMPNTTPIILGSILYFPMHIDLWRPCDLCFNLTRIQGQI